MDTALLGLRVLVSLGAVLALLWWLSRRVASRAGNTGGTAPVRVLSRQAISPKASVVVVEAEGRRFMLGVTEASVSVLNSEPLPDGDGDGAGEAGEAGDTDSFAASLQAASRLDAGARGSAAHDSAARDSASQNSAGPAALPSRRELRRSEPADDPSPLAGSILSAQTWRQSAAVLRGRLR